MKIRTGGQLVAPLTNGWLCQGNHDGSAWETTAGFSGKTSPHLPASGGGDKRGNCVSTRLSRPSAEDVEVTLRARVFWLVGEPKILLRLKGTTIEVNADLNFRNGGTPQQPNKLSNEPLDVTFVYGTNRLIYNARALYTGSPGSSAQYDMPSGALCGYDGYLPPDDPLFGATHRILDFPNFRGKARVSPALFLSGRGPASARGFPGLRFDLLSPLRLPAG